VDEEEVEEEEAEAEADDAEEQRKYYEKHGHYKLSKEDEIKA